MTESHVSDSEDDYGWWDDDDVFLDEPRTTYAEAVAQLTQEAASRADVQVNWRGKRGPKQDASVVFLAQDGSKKLVRRFSSADHLGDFLRLVRGAQLLPKRHALWYPQEDLVVARLVGEYDELINAVGRQIVKLSPGTKVLKDSPLGRDVLGTLLGQGAFATSSPPSDRTTPSRTIRLTIAPSELGTLYSKRFRYGAWLALELSGFATSTEAETEEVLAQYGTSYLHEMARAIGTSLRLWESSYRLAIPVPAQSDLTINFPRRIYDQVPAQLFAAANEASRDSLERYLKYYQVLEFYMMQAAETLKANQSATTVPRAKTPYPSGVAKDDTLGLEGNKLAAVIDLSVTPGELSKFLNGNQLLTSLGNPLIIRHVPIPAEEVTTTSSTDFRPSVAKRVYQIRCRIVHAKESGGKHAPLLQPYGQEAYDLGADLVVVRFLAERALNWWAQSLP